MLKSPIANLSQIPNKEIGIYKSIPPERPMNAIILYAIGSGDGSLVKIGKAGTDKQKDSEKIKAAQKRIAAADDMFRKMRRGAAIYIAASWAQERAEDSIKKFYKHLANTHSSDEMLDADPDLFRFLKYWRKQQHCATGGVEGLMGNPFVDFENWNVAHSHTRIELPEQQDDLFNDRNPYSALLADPYDPKNDYHTPDEIVIAVEELFDGRIDLDPASSDLANVGDAVHRGIRANFYYTQFNSGLKNPWTQRHGSKGARVFLNPPFGEWAAWANKILEEIQRENVKEIVVFINNHSTTAEQVGDLMESATAMLTSRGRLQCWGTLASSPPDGFKLLYIGDQIERFSRLFSQFGAVTFSDRYVMEHFARNG